MKKILPIIISSFFVISLVLSTAVQSADTVEDGEIGEAEKISEKPKKIGFYTESFRILPEVQLTGYTNDNIYATDNSTESDVIAILSPSLNVSSLWDRHSLSLNTGGNIGRYNDNSSEDYEDYWLSMAGKYEYGSNNNLFGGAGYSQKHEGRNSKDSAQNQTEPTVYHVSNMQLGVKHQFDDLTLRLGGTYEKLDFDSAGDLDNDDRDRTASGLGLRVSKNLNKKSRIYLQGLLNQRDYDEATDLNGNNRDSDGYGAGVGYIQALPDKGRIKAYAGILSQDYDDSDFDRVTKADFDIDLLWYPMKTLKFKGSLQRSIRETTQSGASGYVYTNLYLQLDKVLFNNIVAYTSYGYSDSDYQEISREDDFHSFSIGAKYFMTPHVRLTASYSHYSNDSSDDSVDQATADFLDYKQNLFLLAVKVKLAP